MSPVHSSTKPSAVPHAKPAGPGMAVPPFAPSDKKVPTPKAATPAKVPAAATATTPADQGTSVSFGEKALSALENAGKFVGRMAVDGVEGVGDAAVFTAKALGTGVADVVGGVHDAASEGLKLFKAGGKEIGAGTNDVLQATVTGIEGSENAAGDVWGVLTQGVGQATTLLGNLGTDASTLAARAGTAATNLGQGASAVLAGVGNVASSAAGYGAYVLNAGEKLVNEIT